MYLNLFSTSSYFLETTLCKVSEDCLECHPQAILYQTLFYTHFQFLAGMRLSVCKMCKQLQLASCILNKMAMRNRKKPQKICVNKGKKDGRIDSRFTVTKIK